MTKKRHDDYEMGKAVGKAEAEEKASKERETAIVPKELQPYANDLPYSKDRIIEELKFLFQHEVAAKFEIGKRLFLLKEMEGKTVGGNQHSEGVRLAHTLNEHFPGLSQRRAYEYILFAQKATHKFKEWAEGGRNWKKALALLDTLDEKEIKALSDGEMVQGMLFDDIDTMTVTELREDLRRMRKKDTRGKEQLTEKDAEIKRLQKGYNPTEEQYFTMTDGFKLRFEDLMDRVDPELMEQLRKEQNPTAKMKARYLEVLQYMKMRILAACDLAEHVYGTQAMLPDKEKWEPGKGKAVKIDMPAWMKEKKE